MRDYTPMGGGNLPVILVTGNLMFLFYIFGWGYMGTITLVVFVIVGCNSLFPFIALLLWGLYECLLHFQDGIVIGVFIFWIVLSFLFEFAARMMIAEEKEDKQNTSDHENK